MSERLYVVAGLDAEGRIVQWGPTSPRRDLLESYDQSWRSSVYGTAIMPVMAGATLRVSRRSLAAARRRLGIQD